MLTQLARQVPLWCQTELQPMGRSTKLLASCPALRVLSCPIYTNTHAYLVLIAYALNSIEMGKGLADNSYSKFSLLGLNSQVYPNFTTIVQTGTDMLLCTTLQLVPNFSPISAPVHPLRPSNSAIELFPILIKSMLSGARTYKIHSSEWCEPTKSIHGWCHLLCTHFEWSYLHSCY